MLKLLPGGGLDAREVARRQEAAYYSEPFRRTERTGRDLIDEQFRIVNANPTPDFAVQGHLRAIENFAGHRELTAISAPALVIAGDRDRLIVPENSRLIAAGVPDAQLCIPPDTAHFFWAEKPAEAVAEWVRFFTALEE